MARLIDADAVDYENIMCSQSQLHWLNAIIEKQPTVDAVEVVRCKDCKHAYLTYDGEVKYCEIFDKEEAVYLPPSFFCAYGERKSDG